MKWQLFEGRRNLRIEVVPDAQWPNMWRIKQPDGTLSDMVNLTRAKDAATLIAQRQVTNHDPHFHWKAG